MTSRNLKKIEEETSLHYARTNHLPDASQSLLDFPFSFRTFSATGRTLALVFRLHLLGRLAFVLPLAGRLAAFPFPFAFVLALLCPKTSLP